MKTRVIYIGGSITDNPDFRASFSTAEAELTAAGYVALSPAWLPSGLDNAQYMRICFAMIDAADAVLFLPDAEESNGAKLEAFYCAYIHKPYVRSVEDLNDPAAGLFFTSSDKATEIMGELKKKGGKKNGKKA